MAGSSKSKNKNKAEKPRGSANQRKIRLQQIGVAIFAGIVVIAMILSLVAR